MEIDMREIFAKLRTKNDILNFFLEQSKNFDFKYKIINYSFVLSPENHFSKSFYLEYFQEEKNYFR